MDWFLYDNGLRHERVKLFICYTLPNNDAYNASNVFILERCSNMTWHPKLRNVISVCGTYWRIHSFAQNFKGGEEVREWCEYYEIWLIYLISLYHFPRIFGKCNPFKNLRDFSGWDMLRYFDKKWVMRCSERPVFFSYKLLFP